MSIASELSALNGYILGAYDEINDKGGTVPANKNMANLASAIASISGGGGDPNITSGQLILPSGWSSGTDLIIQHGLSWQPTLFFLYYNCFLFGGVRLFLYHNNVLGDMESGYQKAMLNYNGAPTSITNGNSLASGVNYVTSNLTEIKISGSLASIIGSNYINNYKAYWWAMHDANSNDFSAIT